MTPTKIHAPSLFLDLDGVVHPLGVAHIDRFNKASGDRLFRWLPILLDSLEAYPEVVIVVHSSWRLCWGKEEMLEQLPPELVAKIVDVTDPGIYSRYKSIQDYILRHDITKYIILDDEGKQFPENLPELVVCRPKEGLSRPSTKAKLQKSLANL